MRQKIFLKTVIFCLALLFFVTVLFFLMDRKTIYPINCTCCDPPVLLTDSNSKQNHRKKQVMPKKRIVNSEDEAIPALMIPASSNPAAKNPKIAVNIYKTLFFFLIITKLNIFILFFICRKKLSTLC